MRRILASALLLFTAPAASAHPHVFVDTALHIVTDDAGRITGVEVHWAYDELYSLLVLEDMALDDDYDGVLTEAELEALHGFDMNWVEGFAGDLYASRSGGALVLGPPQPRGTEFADGKIVTRHYRPLADGTAQSVTLRAYDPTFYTAYDLTGGVHAPEGCEVAIEKPDLDSAYAEVEDQLEDLPPDPEDYPAVGDLFADTVVVSCG
ncbi:DUF1007 family protein [Lutimaribacter sp. EGI FJ00015]|uniref:DUF1007 family protein n=1 Tax=Lutimaribacter degradans TaxID=2945989 RepID=A0ACC5ZZP3_9RHOB|nr:DUF1007 family protein [Lutimaribacter sp. EGI FJ00013]MCM2563843.1 DUF1007 family protein [Lutimaribacter sp. EGI FJ00013]MCO0615002.1 DUF1007 family protein [Lutimaribacter sp. EGI FJ00015]MCO0637666.1 DUF1007 family protein [Lutimaribacter sp. EGI FJ00014]